VANQTQKAQNKILRSSVKEWIQKVKGIPFFSIRNLCIAILFVVTLYLISPPLILPRVTLDVGDFPKESVLAEIDFAFVDSEATRLAKEHAASSIPPVYILDQELVQSSIADAESYFDKIGQDVLNPVFSRDERMVLLSKYMPSSTTENTLSVLADLDEENFKLLRSASHEVIGDILNKGVLSDVPGSAKEISISKPGDDDQDLMAVDEILTLGKAPDRIERLAAEKFPDDESLRVALKELSLPFIRKTLTFDEGLTETAQAEARKATPAVTVSFKKNQEIVQAGHEVTQQDIFELDAHAHALSKANRFQIYAGNALVLVMVFGCFLLYVWRFRPDVFNKNQNFMLIGILVFLTLATGRLFLLLSLPAVWLYLVPVAAGAILLSILVDDRIALVYSFFISILYSAQGNYNISLFLIAMFGSLAGVFQMRTIRKRSDIFWPGIVVGAVNVATIFALYLIGLIHEDLKWTLLSGIINGLATAVFIVPGSLTPLEFFFGIVTNIRLLELSDLNHPLLRRMAMQAPGTYHHSLMVGHMAEAAAEAIGANSLLARVGSYFHDVGKMNKPLYFSENQRGGKNKHDELTPSMSALVLIAHVKEGVELAREYKLNQPIIDFIQQHQGTGLMPFFYRKAMEQDPEHAVDEENFRYPGPRPQSRETAICMLADAAEAASRTLSNPTHGRIKTLVEKMINNKYIDSQLDECDLTLQDITVIRDSFVMILAGFLHSRVEYPAEQTATEIKGKFEGTDTKVGAKTRNKSRADSSGD
jgi:putative nucleotidyltransferase with HDIG domain